MSLPESPQSRGEQYLAKMAGMSVDVPESPQSRMEQYLDYIAKHGGGGGGGMNDYSDLLNKPTINGVTLSGNKAPSDLGLVSSDDLSGVTIVNNMTELLSTTADKVIVLHDDSDWGDGSQVMFVKSTGPTLYGYKRNDNSVMYPVANQKPLPTANAPIKEMMSVIKTWVGNPDVHHGESNANITFTNGLFGSSPGRDNSNLFPMDCASFVSAVILGITYQNSRFVLGSAADNITGEYVGDNLLKNSRATFSDGVTPLKPKGGLNASETAIWYAQHGRLFEFPEDETKAHDMLRFGDILFGSNDSSAPNAYYNIEHILIYLGGSTCGYIDKTFTNVQSVNIVDVHEQQNVQLMIGSLHDRIGPGHYYRVFARPNYGGSPSQAAPTIIPIGNGMYTYDCFFLPCAMVKRGGTSIDGPNGYIRGSDYNFATPDYLPVIPNSTLAYTGPSANSRGQAYTVRTHEYGANHEWLKDGLLAWSSGGTPRTATVTLTANTKYLRFTFCNASDHGVYLNDIDDFSVTITPPST